MNAKVREERYLRDKAKEEADLIAAFKERLKEKVNNAITVEGYDLASFPSGTHGSGVRSGRINALKFVLTLIDQTS